MRGIGGHTKPISGATDNWLTPPEMIRALGPFDTDPCCPESMPWRTARRMIIEKDCGLNTPWSGRVFMNAPYSKNTQFAQKFADHGNGIALFFARTDTAWFRILYDADAFLFLSGRIHFYHLNGERAKGNSGGPSVLVAYDKVGNRNVDALRDYRNYHGNSGLLLVPADDRGDK